MSELMSRGLPKWPQHYVTGVPVTVEQAKEIIRRTDTFFEGGGYGGNNHKFNRRIRTLLGMPPDFMDEPKKQETPEETAAYWVRRDQMHQAFRERWRPVSTEYVHNSWVSCAFIGGPHGWCHPDGQIRRQRRQMARRCGHPERLALSC